LIADTNRRRRSKLTPGSVDENRGGSGALILGLATVRARILGTATP